MEQNTSVKPGPDDDTLFTEATALISDAFGDQGPHHLDRLRFRRPGPKSWTAERFRGMRSGTGRIAVLPAELDDVEPLASLPGDDLWWPPPATDHPYVFRSLMFGPDGRPIPDTGDNKAWARAVVANAAHQRVAKTILFDHGARVRVSTVFLGGTDMGGTRSGMPPVLFETMIFLGDRDRRKIPGGCGAWRYMSRNAAVRGHAQIVGTLRTAWGRA